MFAEGIGSAMGLYGSAKMLFPNINIKETANTESYMLEIISILRHKKIYHQPWKRHIYENKCKHHENEHCSSSQCVCVCIHKRTVKMQLSIIRDSA